MTLPTVYLVFEEDDDVTNEPGAFLGAFQAWESAMAYVKARATDGLEIRPTEVKP